MTTLLQEPQTSTLRHQRPTPTATRCDRIMDLIDDCLLDLEAEPVRPCRPPADCSRAEFRAYALQLDSWERTVRRVSQ